MTRQGKEATEQHRLASVPFRRQHLAFTLEQNKRRCKRHHRHGRAANAVQTSDNNKPHANCQAQKAIYPFKFF